MEKDFSNIWNKALNLLEEETSLIAYKTYIELIKPELVDENTVCFSVPSKYHMEVCKQRYLLLIKSVLAHVTNKEDCEYNITFKIRE